MYDYMIFQNPRKIRVLKCINMTVNQTLVMLQSQFYFWGNTS